MKSTGEVSVQKVGRDTYRVSARNGRSALTGKFISKSTAQRHPSVTVAESKSKQK